MVIILIFIQNSNWLVYGKVCGRYAPTSVHVYQDQVTTNTTYCNVSGQFYRLDFIGGKGGPKHLF